MKSPSQSYLFLCIPGIHLLTSSMAEKKRDRQGIVRKESRLPFMMEVEDEEADGRFDPFHRSGILTPFGRSRRDLGPMDVRKEDDEREWKHPYYIPVVMPRVKAPVVDMSTYLHQCGTVEIQPGIHYNGELEMGIPHGYGCLYDMVHRECMYEGAFCKGIYQGSGTLYRNGQRYKDGIFQSGQLVEGRTLYPDGSIFVGKYRDGKRHGADGRFILPSGVMMKGAWNQDRPDGKIEITVSTENKVISADNHDSQEFVIGTTYDFQHPDDNTKFTISFQDDRLAYEDNYMLKKARPVFIFYFNGDVFVGDTDSSYNPANGWYYHLVASNYQTMMIGAPVSGMEIVKVYYHDKIYMKDMRFIIKEI